MDITDEQLREMVCAIAEEVDYDIYKNCFLEDDDAIETLIGIAKDSLEIE